MYGAGKPIASAEVVECKANGAAMSEECSVHARFVFLRSKQLNDNRGTGSDVSPNSWSFLCAKVAVRELVMGIWFAHL